MERTDALARDGGSKNGAGGRRKGRPRAFDRARALHRALEVFWEHGYEPASVAMLCEAMDINPPSLYATFGNKSDLFLEALRHYELTYWTKPSEDFEREPDVRRAVETFFRTSARILLSPKTPCGCMVVLAAINICPREVEIIDEVRRLRIATKQMFADRLERAVADGQLPEDTDVFALSNALNTYLEGLSIQARDGLTPEQLESVAALAVSLLPLPRGEGASG